MAKVIEATQRPAIILAPNKTLAAQLYGEFKSFFPRPRGGVFRLLLRLLPAGSLHPAHRHLHREGFLDQRADRSHAPFGDARAARTRTTSSSWPRCPASTVSARSRPTPAMTFTIKKGDRINQRQFPRRPWSHGNTSARRRISRAAPSGCAAIPSTSSPPTTRIAPGAVNLCRRRGGVDPRVRSAHRPQDRRARVREDLRQTRTM